ncbi:MAG: glycosyltransferase [Clostridia bacterium]|nr:glycosyltransferase [Clostridia bacterium]
MKKRILVIGITMAAAGSEKSFLSFATHAIDYNKYDVDLLLAKKEGDFLDKVPREINILEMGEMGEIFLLDRKNASSIIIKEYLAKNPFRAFSLMPHMMKRLTAQDSREKTFAAQRMWLELMKKMPVFEKEYDIALAYWGDRTMFYMVDKVKSAKKIAWLHFDYGKPPREDALYEAYFSACDKVVTVSSEIEKSLKNALPSIADRVVTVENIIDREEILRMAEEKADFGDDFAGVRIVTVGRICEQKGYDLAVPAIAKLCADRYDIKWYILGKGSEEEEAALAERIRSHGMEERISVLGIRKNPYPYIKEADIYMQPSRHEGKPIAVEEAKILGKSILVTGYTSAREQMKNYPVYKIAEISEEGIYQNLKTMLSKKIPFVSKNPNGEKTDYKRIFENLISEK